MCLSINQSHNWIEKETVLRERGKNTRDEDFVQYVERYESA